MTFIPTYDNSLLKERVSYEDTHTSATDWLSDGKIANVYFQPNRKVTFDLGKEYKISHFLFNSFTDAPDRMYMIFYDKEFNLIHEVLPNSISLDPDYSLHISPLSLSKVQYVSVENRSGSSWNVREMNVWGTSPTNKYLFQDGEEIKKYENGDIFIFPKMTSNMSPSPYIVSASGEHSSLYPAWKAFNDSDDLSLTDAWWSDKNHGWIQVDLNKSTIINKYKISTNNSNDNYNSNSPRDLTFEGSHNEEDWVVLDTQTNLEWSLGETKVFSLENKIAYRFYRVNVSRNRSSISSKLIIPNIELEGVELSKWQTIGSALATKEMFDSHGITDLSIIDNEAIQALESDEVELLCWTDEEEFEELTDNVIPKMTNYTSPSGEASSSSNTSFFGAWRAFDKLNGTDDCWRTSNLPAWLAYEFDEEKNIKAYAVTSRNAGNSYARPTAWTFEGSNDKEGTWDILDSQSDISFESNERKVFYINNTKKYKKYRIHVTESGTSNLAIGELEMYESISLPVYRNINLTAIPLPQLLFPKEDIEVGEIESVKVEVNIYDSGDLKILVSEDNGVSWKGKSPADPANLTEVKANGFTPEVTNNYVDHLPYS